MAVDAPLVRDRAAPEVACVAADGCSYLRALSTIEHIAGFEHTARSYAAAAARCREQGCWAARKDDADVPPPPAPLPFKAFRRSSPRLAPQRQEAVTVPFDRTTFVDLVSDTAGNYIERRALKLSSLPARGDSLGSLYLYWCELRTAGALRFSSIDTVQLTRAGIVGKMHIVNVASSDPQEFRFELLGYDVPMGQYESPRAHPITIWADSVMRDYNTVRLTATPRLYRMRCRLGDISHHYTRLILPFVDKRTRVTRLLVAIREEAGNGVKVKAGD